MIRVSCGFLKNRLLKSSAGTKPTRSAVRESVFNILCNMVDMKNLVVLDGFAGSGAFGFEALSRGAGYVYFCEKSKPAFEILKDNAKNILNDATLNNNFNSCPVFIHMGDLIKLRPRHDIDVAFLDPPYSYDVVPYVNYLQKKLKGILIIESLVEKKIEAIEGFSFIKSRDFGQTSIGFWEKKRTV